MAGAFDDTTVDGSHWCSRGDCNDMLRGNIGAYCDDEVDKLNRAIDDATGIAKAILRAGWPDEDWPFTGLPNELRRCVATIATHEVFFGRTLPAELEVLAAEREWAEAFLRGIVSGENVLAMTGQEKLAERVAVTRGTDWAQTEYGFGHATRP